MNRWLLLSCIVAARTLAATATLQLSPTDLAQLAAKSAAAKKRPIETVVDKPKPSPTGDAHDYVSFARYWWPDPKSPNGLPYVRHDGHHNEAQVALGDHDRMFAFSSTVIALAAGWSVNHDEAAARRAGEWLRAWFITPATRMNPNLEYSQVRLGHAANHGAASGLLDGRGFIEVVEGLQLLRGSPALSAADEATIHAWFSQYLDWLLNSKNGRAEHAARNNHGSWYLAQAIAVACDTGRDDVARQLAEEDKTLLAHQLKPDGSQPEELQRVDGLGYSAFNLEAQFTVARLANGLGVDLWHYATPSGAGLRTALAFLTPYNTAPEKWPHAQHAKLAPGFLDALLVEAGKVWP